MLRVVATLLQRVLANAYDADALFGTLRIRVHVLRTADVAATACLSAVLIRWQSRRKFDCLDKILRRANIALGTSRRLLALRKNRSVVDGAILRPLPHTLPCLEHVRRVQRLLLLLLSARLHLLLITVVMMHLVRLIDNLACNDSSDRRELLHLHVA